MGPLRSTELLLLGLHGQTGLTPLPSSFPSIILSHTHTHTRAYPCTLPPSTYPHACVCTQMHTRAHTCTQNLCFRSCVICSVFTHLQKSNIWADLVSVNYKTHGLSWILHSHYLSSKLSACWSHSPWPLLVVFSSPEAASLFSLHCLLQYLFKKKLKVYIKNHNFQYNTNVFLL